MTRTALKERTTTNATYIYCGDRFAAISFLMQVRRNLCNRECVENVKADYIDSFEDAHRSYILRDKGCEIENTDITFMSCDSDIEGFDMSFSCRYEKAIAVVDVFELSNFESMFVIRYEDASSDVARMIAKVFDANASRNEPDYEDNECGFENYGSRECSFPIKLDLNLLLTDEDRKELGEKAAEISKRNIFNI